MRYLLTDILVFVEEQKTLKTKLRKKLRKRLGHVLRHDSLLKKVIEGQMKGRKILTGKMEMLLYWSMKREYQMDYSQLKRMTEDRTQWH